jgi:putative glutamine amidotransferase
VNHRPGREVIEAHAVRVVYGSRLAGLLSKDASPEIQVNSSHHQAISVPGDNLRVCAVSPVDGVIEAVELDTPGHFVVAVQWHPERTYTQSAFSRELFAAFVGAAAEWNMEEQVAQA